MSTSPSSETASPPAQRRLFGAPPRAGALAEWALVPLRLFLGVTFLFAGLQKLANPGFFNEKSPSSIQAQLTGAARVSPLHALLSHLLSYAVPIGITIAIAEVAIGLGTLLGLWSRIAAVGGALVSLSLFFTVSFHSSPYYTGSDIVFLFAWIPLIISGPDTRLSMDARIAAQAATSQGAPSPVLVAVPFATVQRLCGHFNESKCAARNNEPCEDAACPVLVAGDQGESSERLDAVHRRTVIVRSAATAVVGASAALFAAGTAEVGKLIAGNPTTAGVNELGATSVTTTAGQSSSTGSSKNLGTLLGAAKDVAPGRPAVFTIPSSGDPGIVIELAKGDYVGFDTVCPHMGCTVQYSPSNNMLVCPCHHSEFYANNGDVIQGPAPHGLTKLDIVEGSDGNLYLR